MGERTTGATPICNLYRLNRATTEIARIFDVAVREGSNHAEEVYPGYNGLVIAGRQARSMTWGFPLVQIGKSGKRLKPKPVTNARDDKLQTSFWRTSFEQRRCLIPVSAWAEPDGEPGRMTRTWYSLPQAEPFAIGGIWKASEEWGECYAMVMVNASSQMAEVHDRMPVLLPREAWRSWLIGSPREAMALVRTWDGELEVDATQQRWAGR